MNDRIVDELWLSGECADSFGMPDLGAVAASNVRAERSRKGWTQRQLGEALGWSTDMVSNLETGQRRIALADLPPLCAALGVTLERLLMDADPADLRRIGLN